MEMVLERAAFCDAVQSVSGALNQRAPRPALQCIHLEAAASGVIVSSTDLRISIRREIAAEEVRDAGAGLIHGTRLASLLRELTDEKVVVRIRGGRAQLTGARSSFKMTSHDVDAYPELPRFTDAAVRLASSEFERAAQGTLFATAQEQGRYALDGVSLLVEGGLLELAATDGRRLAVAAVEVKVEGEFPRCIVPARLLGEIRRLAAGGEELELAAEGSRLLARSRGGSVAGTLIDGTFPAYRDMIPEERGSVLRASAVELASRLRQALQVTTDESRAVALHLSSNELKIESRSAAVGEASISMDAEYTGSPMTISFNPRFLLDALPLFGEEEALIEVDVPERPAVMRREGFVYVIAPVRTRDRE